MISAIGLATLLTFSACGSSDGEEEAPASENGSPEAIFEEAVDNMVDVESASLDLNVKGSVSAEESVGLGYTSADFDFSLSGDIDGSEDAPTANFKLDATGSIDNGDTENVNSEIRVSTDTMYFIVNTFSDFDGAIPSEDVAPFLGQWWSIPLPEGYADSFSLPSDVDEDLTPEEQALADLFEETSFFQDVKHVNDEKVGSADTYHYTMTLDKEATQEYIRKSAEIYETPLTSSDEEEMKEFFETLEVDGEAWVGKEDTMLRKISTDISIPDLEGMALDLVVTYTIDNINESITVTAPEGATEFDPFSMF